MYIVFVMMCIEVHVLYVVHVKPRSKCLIIVVRNKFKNMSKPLSLLFSSPELKNSVEFFLFEVRLCVCKSLRETPSVCKTLSSTDPLYSTKIS